MGQSAEELSRLEELLRRPDFILEPSCMSTIVEYVKSGGTPQTVIEILTDGYMGTAHTSSLMCQWLNSFSNEDLDADGLPEGSQDMNVDVNSTGGATTSSGSVAGKLAQDEAAFLQEFVRTRFDPDRVADVFVVRQGKPPPWLEGLTADPRGRSLVYTLSALHRNCLLLNFAIQKILLQGHEAEVAVVGGSLASYFTVFHRLLAARLRAALAAMTPSSSSAGVQPNGSMQGGGSSGGAEGADNASSGDSSQPGSLPNLARELADSCSGAAHAYLHAQQLLGVLSRHPCGAAFLRLSQELELATAKQYPVAWATQHMLLPPGSPQGLIEAARLVGRCLSATGQGLPGNDIKKLVQLYHNSAHISLSPIQHPAFIQLLISGIFIPGKPPPSDVVDAALQLLAHATSAPFDLTHAHHQQHQYGPHEGLNGDYPDLLEALQPPANNSHHVKGFDAALETRQDNTKAALRAALALGLKTNSRFTPEDFEQAQQIVQVPVAAAALLHCLHVQLTSRDYWQEQSAAMLAAPGCLRLLLMIATTQKQFMQRVVDLLSASLIAMGSQRAELAHAFSGALVVLLRDVGAVQPVMAAMDKWALEADPSLVRHALLQILSSAAPPYSVAFAQWLIKHMVGAGMRRKHAHGAGEVLREFATACLSMAASSMQGTALRPSSQPRLVLDAKQQACLTELTSAR